MNKEEAAMHFFAIEGQFILGGVKGDCFACAWDELERTFPGAQLGCVTGADDGKGCMKNRPREIVVGPSEDARRLGIPFDDPTTEPSG